MKRLSSGSRIVLKSHFACEISRVNIYQDRQEETKGERVGQKFYSSRKDPRFWAFGASVSKITINRKAKTRLAAGRR